MLNEKNRQKSIVRMSNTLTKKLIEKRVTSLGFFKFKHFLLDFLHFVF